MNVASGERRFSRLKFVRRLPRPTMTDERTDSLMIMICEDDICSNIDNDKTREEWQKMCHCKNKFFNS